MSLKRPLSPESSLVPTESRQLKRLKLHSIIQQLRNEEAKLILLKKLRSSQQLATRTNKSSIPITNDFYPTATHIPAILPIKPITNLPLPQQSMAEAEARKKSNSPLLTNSNKIAVNQSSEERKNQAKLALRKQLERDLSSIPRPKPALQDVLFIPNGGSLEFTPLLGLEDVIQCLNELQSDRHRLPQRFTDHALIDNPHICDQCGTDFTIRWWKHVNPKSSIESINILCDRCKKQVVRRTTKSEHSTLLKNVFIPAMKQEKDIEKNFHSLIKQEKNSTSSRSKSSTNNSQQQIQSMSTMPAYLLPSKHHYQTKHSLPQNFTTKISQQFLRKSNGNVPTPSNHSRTVQHPKTSMPIHHRPLTAFPQPTKTNQMVKMPKSTLKQQTVLPSSHSIYPSSSELLDAILVSTSVRPTATKRRTIPTTELK